MVPSGRPFVDIIFLRPDIRLNFHTVREERWFGNDYQSAAAACDQRTAIGRGFFCHRMPFCLLVNKGAVQCNDTVEWRWEEHEYSAAAEPKLHGKAISGQSFDLMNFNIIHTYSGTWSSHVYHWFRGVYSGSGCTISSHQISLVLVRVIYKRINNKPLVQPPPRHCRPPPQSQPTVKHSYHLPSRNRWQLGSQRRGGGKLIVSPNLQVKTIGLCVPLIASWAVARPTERLDECDKEREESLLHETRCRKFSREPVN